MKAAAAATIGKRLERAREAAGVSAVKLATDCGISESAWHNWRSGRSVPNGAQITRVALYLGATPNDFLLTDPGDVVDSTLTEADAESLAEIRASLIVLNRLTCGIVRPFAVVETMVRSLEETYAPRAARIHGLAVPTKSRRRAAGKH